MLCKSRQRQNLNNNEKKSNGLLKHSTFIIILLVLGIIISFSTFFYFQSLTSSKEQFKKRGESLSSLFAITCKSPLYYEKTNDLAEALLNIASQSDIVYAYIYDANGDVVSSHNKSETDFVLDENMIEKMNELSLYHTEGEIWDFYAPVTFMGEDFLESYEENFIGFVRIGLSQEFLQNTMTRIVRVSLIFAFFALLAGVIISIVVARNILYPVIFIADKVESIGTDLAQRIEVKRNDEIGRLAKGVNSFLSSLREVVKELTVASPELHDQAVSLSAITEQVTAASQEITSSVQEIAISSQKQMDDITQVVADAKTAQKIASETVEVAQKTKQLSGRTLQISREGKREAEEAFESSENMVNSIETLSSRITSLVEEIEQVPKIIDTINGISKKTSILSLNAMIEAARAGEYGRGFSVVAQEISKLADKSRMQADEISKIVGGVIEKTSSMVFEAQKTREGITQSKEIFMSAATRLRTISEEMEKAVGEIENIVKKGNFSEEAVNRLVKIIDKIAEESQLNAAAAEEVSASVEEQTAAFNTLTETTVTLSNLAEKLKTHVSRFKV